MTKTESPHGMLSGVGFLLWTLSCGMVVGATYVPEFGDFENRIYGCHALAFGWLLVIGGCPAWLANPLILGAAVLLHFEKRFDALVTATIAMGCSLSILAFYSPLPTLGEKYEAVLCHGGWIWLSGICCLWTNTVIAWRSNRRQAAHLRVTVPSET